jgi:hypothetical protein
MFRVATTRAPNAAATGVRRYTDYRKHEYPHIQIVTGGVYACIVVGWMGFLSWGSVWWESNREWKRQINSSWARRLPKGYVWADELPQEPIKNIYKNVPSGAE